jgi:hypothetical protein
VGFTISASSGHGMSLYSGSCRACLILILLMSHPVAQDCTDHATQLQFFKSDHEYQTTVTKPVLSHAHCECSYKAACAQTCLHGTNVSLVNATATLSCSALVGI